MLSEEDATIWKFVLGRNKKHTEFCCETPWKLTIGK
jgi:hypothetical protein